MNRRAAPTELWSYTQIANHTGIRAGTLRVWRTRGHLPCADFKIGDYLAWKPETVRHWWKQREDGPVIGQDQA